MKSTDFIDGLRPIIARAEQLNSQTPEIAKLMDVYDMMTLEQQKHVNRIGVKLWANSELSPSGAFELTMAILDWSERIEQ